MNTDQFLSLLRTLLKVAGASIVTHGYMTAGHVEFTIGAILALLGYICSHVTHSDDSAPAMTQPNLPKIMSVLFLFAFISASVGCTTSAAFKGEKATAVTVEHAMSGWNDYVGQFHPGVNAESKVKSAFEKYRVAELTAIDATAAYAKAQTDANKSTMHAATAAVAASLTDLVAVVQSFGVKL